RHPTHTLLLHDALPISSHHYDFWFVNEYDKGMVIGLRGKACTCSSVDVYLLPEERRRHAELASVASAVAALPAGPLAACCAADQIGRAHVCTPVTRSAR